MANPFRDMSVFMQGLVAVAIAVVVLLLGVYIPLSPVAQERDAVDKAVQQRSTLNTEVQQLQVYRQRYGELNNKWMRFRSNWTRLKPSFRKKKRRMNSSACCKVQQAPPTFSFGG